MNNEERIAVLETQQKEIKNDISELKTITETIYRLSYNIETMCNEMKSMNERITALEKEPMENYKSLKKKIVEYIVTAILGIIIGYLATKF